MKISILILNHINGNVSSTTQLENIGSINNFTQRQVLGGIRYLRSRKKLKSEHAYNPT